jgi:hypothetical protein
MTPQFLGSRPISKPRGLKRSTYNADLGQCFHREILKRNLLFIGWGMSDLTSRYEVYLQARRRKMSPDLGT